MALFFGFCSVTFFSTNKFWPDSSRRRLRKSTLIDFPVRTYLIDAKRKIHAYWDLSLKPSHHRLFPSTAISVKGVGSKSNSSRSCAACDRRCSSTCRRAYFESPLKFPQTPIFLRLEGRRIGGRVVRVVYCLWNCCTTLYLLAYQTTYQPTNISHEAFHPTSFMS